MAADKGQVVQLQQIHAAARNYQPRPYNSPVLLIRGPRGILGLVRDTRLGWGEMLGTALEVCETEGNMYGDLDRLVEKVRESLKHGEQRWQDHLGGAGQMD